jgi:carbon starvation protein
MKSLFIALFTGLLYIVAYNTYGKWLARKIFKLDPNRKTPAFEHEDGVDYVPSRRSVVFGHHFTSIAGTGPIVGPAIAIIWGWVPGLLWVLIGSIFMGAVHDFGAMALSLRSRGRSIADICGSIVNTRIRILFYAVIFFELWMVIAIFCLVIASIFHLYPSSVFPVWCQIPVAVIMGVIARKKGISMKLPALVALGIMYITIYLGAKYPELQFKFVSETFSPVLLWSIILLIYCFIASILPVNTLLQPRDYINANQLMFMLALLFLGVFTAQPEMVAPAYDLTPRGAPPIFPFIFITIACGAISGFHALVSSGISSKQISNEEHALSIGYGGMLLEGYLSILVIIAVGAGIGIISETSDGKIVAGVAAWNSHYASWGMANTLGRKIGAFVEGGANLLRSFYIPRNFGIALLGVFVASFASTTLDSATRLQRYVIAEFGETIKFKPLMNRYVATAVAILSAVVLAMWDVHGAKGWNLKGCGKGGLTLWPLFGAINQLLAGLSLMVITVWLYKNKKNIWITAIPMLFMIVMTGWAMLYNLGKFYSNPGQQHLFWIGIVVFILEIWMIIETFLVFLKTPSPKKA